MTTLGMTSDETQDPSRRLKGLVLVIALHAFLGYILVSGMARKGITLIKEPLEAVVIQEVIIPPPPPPPPPAPAAVGPKHISIGLACPTQMPP